MSSHLNDHGNGDMNCTLSEGRDFRDIEFLPLISPGIKGIGLPEKFSLGTWLPLTTSRACTFPRTTSWTSQLRRRRPEKRITSTKRRVLSKTLPSRNYDHDLSLYQCDSIDRLHFYLINLFVHHHTPDCSRRKLQLVHHVLSGRHPGLPLQYTSLVWYFHRI